MCYLVLPRQADLRLITSLALARGFQVQSSTYELGGPKARTGHGLYFTSAGSDCGTPIGALNATREITRDRREAAALRKANDGDPCTPGDLYGWVTVQTLADEAVSTGTIAFTDLIGEDGCERAKPTSR